MPPEVVLDICKILELLPHRFPFLLVDRVTELVPGERLVALKNVTANEPWVIGHWPGDPVMPGVLLLEAAFQAAGILLAYEATEGEKRLSGVAAAANKVRWRRPVVPGDQLVISVESTKSKGLFRKFSFAAKVDDEVACEGEITLVINHDSEEESPTGAL